MGNSGMRPLDQKNMKVDGMVALIDGRTMRATDTIRTPSTVLIGVCLVLSCVVLSSPSVVAQAAPPQSRASIVQAKAVGEIKSISGSTITLTTDDGKNVSISLSENVRVVR